MGNPVLIITDGTAAGTVDLLSKTRGMRVVNWEPAVAAPKEGGIWQQSPFADGRQIIISKLGNVIETYEMSVIGESRNDIIIEPQELRRLLDKARTYWTNKQQHEPVWIEARADCETYSRYAEIVDWRTPQDGNPFGSTFLSPIQPLFDDFPLAIERKHWKENPPGESSCVELSEGGYTSSYLEFDGAGTLVTCGTDGSIDDLPAGVNGFTAEAWIRADGWGEGGFGRIFQKLHANAGWYLRINQPNNRILAEVECFNNDALSEVSFDIDGLWHHFVMHYDDTAVNRYIYFALDGIWYSLPYLTQNAGVGVYQADAPDIMYIGGGPGATEVWDGGIGWCRLSDTLRYIAGVNFTPPARCSPPYVDVNTQAQWHFWEGEGLVVKDYSQNTALNYGAITLGAGEWGPPDCPGVRVDTCEAEVFIANHHKRTQITDIYLHAGGVGAWSDNLVHVAPPYFLFTPLDEDMLYFGVDTSLEPSGPFTSLVFDINPTLVDMTVQWEYLTNAGWAALTVIPEMRDNTNQNGDEGGQPFDTRGVNMVSWNLGNMRTGAGVEWVTGAVHGVTGWWVRAHVTAVGGAEAAPKQQNRRIYTVSWPFYEVDSDIVGGDIEALARHFLEYSAYSGVVANPSYGNLHSCPHRVIMGLRSNSRGENFTPFINLAQEQNPAGITVSDVGPWAVFTNVVEAPTGECIQLNPTFDNGLIAMINIDRTINDEYCGNFRMFLRTRTLAPTISDLTIYMSVEEGEHFGPTYYPVRRFIPWGHHHELCDFGKISLPLSSRSNPLATNDVPRNLYFNFFGTWPGVLPTADMRCYDFILMPTDEWAGEFIAYLPEGNRGDALQFFRYLDVDSVVVPKVDLRAMCRWSPRAATSGLLGANYQGYLGGWKTISPSKTFLQANSKQRLWVLSDSAATEDHQNWRYSFQEMAYDTQSFKNAQYYSMRGDR